MQHRLSVSSTTPHQLPCGDVIRLVRRSSSNVSLVLAPARWGPMSPRFPGSMHWRGHKTCEGGSYCCGFWPCPGRRTWRCCFLFFDLLKWGPAFCPPSKTLQKGIAEVYSFRMRSIFDEAVSWLMWLRDGHVWRREKRETYR